MSSPRASTHAIAICATVAPRSAATAASASTRARLRSRRSPWKRGLNAGSRRAASARSRDQWPLSSPRDSTPYAVIADAELAARRQDRVLDAARDERVLDLQVGDRVHRGGAADRVGADLGQADVAHVAGLHQLGDGADGLLDRHLRVDAGRPVDVDVLGAQPPQRVGERSSAPPPGARRCRPSRRRRVAQGAELDADAHAVAAAPRERLADEQLVVAHPVEVAGVEQRDAGVQRGVDGGDALAPVGRPVEVGHAHAAEAERRDLAGRSCRAVVPSIAVSIVGGVPLR